MLPSGSLLHHLLSGKVSRTLKQPREEVYVEGAEASCKWPAETWLWVPCEWATLGVDPRPQPSLSDCNPTCHVAAQLHGRCRARTTQVGHFQLSSAHTQWDEKSVVVSCKLGAVFFYGNRYLALYNTLFFFLSWRLVLRKNNLNQKWLKKYMVLLGTIWTFIMRWNIFFFLKNYF